MRSPTCRTASFLLALLASLDASVAQAADVIPGVGPVAERRAAYQRAIVYRIFLKDGTTRESSKLPLAAFGSLVLQVPGGSSQSLPLASVDLPRSEASWDETLIWDLLDRSGHVGKRLPPMSLVVADGGRTALQPTRWTYVDLYRSYCQPCHAALAAVQSWLRAEPRGIDVVAICVDCTAKQLDAIVEDRGLDGTPGWTNARFEREPAWLASTMGTSSTMSFLVGPDGVVRHANLRPRRKDLFPVALERAWTEEIEAQGRPGP